DESAPTRKIEPKGNQPFRPSMVPSPIYGFNYPEKVKVNYEVEDSFVQNKINDEPFHDYEVNKVEIVNSSPTESYEVEKLEEQEELTILEQDVNENEILIINEKQHENESVQDIEVLEEIDVLDNQSEKEELEQKENTLITRHEEGRKQPRR